MLNTILVESPEHGIAACKVTMRKLASHLLQKAVKLILCNDTESVLAEYLTGALVSLLVRGAYCVDKLPSDEFVGALKETLHMPYWASSEEQLREIKSELGQFYKQDVVALTKSKVVDFVKRSYIAKKRKNKKLDLKGTIEEYFIKGCISDTVLQEMVRAVEKGVAR